MAYEFRQATVRQKGRGDPTFHLEVNPALPDLTREWTGEATSRFVMDVNGQRSHGVGSITVRHDGQGAAVLVQGEKPWWVKARPFAARVRRLETAVSRWRAAESPMEAKRCCPRPVRRRCPNSSQPLQQAEQSPHAGDGLGHQRTHIEVVSVIGDAMVEAKMGHPLDAHVSRIGFASERHAPW